MFGSTEILLFYNFLTEKVLTLEPNQPRKDCDCLEVQLMDESIIRRVKEIVIKRKIAEKENEENSLAILEQKFEHLEDKMNNKLKTLEDKIDLLLSRM